MDILFENFTWKTPFIILWRYDRSWLSFMFADFLFIQPKLGEWMQHFLSIDPRIRWVLSAIWMVFKICITITLAYYRMEKVAEQHLLAGARQHGEERAQTRAPKKAQKYIKDCLDRTMEIEKNLDSDSEGDAQCMICLAEVVTEGTLRCAFCTKCIGCARCVMSSVVHQRKNTRDKSASCPNCRETWDGKTVDSSTEKRKRAIIY